MDLLARLRLMPPGSLVPAEWVLNELEENACAAGVEPNQRGADALVDLTIAEVAQALGRKESTVRGWCASGALRGAYKLNKRDWRIPRAVLLDYQRRQAEPSSLPEHGRARVADMAAWRNALAANG